MPYRRSSLVAALLVGLAAGPCLAQSAPFGRGAVEIGVFGGLLDGKAPDGVGFWIDRDPVYGGRLGYVFGNGIFLLGEGAYSEQTLVTPTGRNALKTLRAGGQLGYAFQPGRSFQILLSAGAGTIRWTPEGGTAETDLALTGGAGLRLFLGPSVALRIDARDHFVPDALSTTRDRLQLPGLPSGGGSAGSGATHNLELTAGLSLFLGGDRDADGDGVADDRDRCSATPAGTPVDVSGCPVDADADGVADHVDRCPGTRPGVVVGRDGCAVDTDGDGVADGLDGCSDTPAGAAVDAQGCPTDADGDGVLDGPDRCPDTPAGATVDAKGCPMDADGDGVLDGLDQCPDTPPAAEVDVDGCSRVEAGLEAGRLVLEDVHFDVGEADVRPDSRTILDEVGRALLDRPDLRVEIQGHTDATGSAETNRALSERRAEAVRAYLLSAFPELDASRLSIRGYGESRPVAPNDTADGRAKNRRVEFVVVDGT